MAKVEVGTETADFDTRDTVTFPVVIIPSDVTTLFYLRANPRNVMQEGSYVTVEARYGVNTGNERTPLICKFFYVGGEMVFAVHGIRIRDQNTQRVRIRLRPKEFYRGTGEIRQIDMTLSWEDTITYPIGMSLP